MQFINAYMRYLFIFIKIYSRHIEDFRKENRILINIFVLWETHLNINN